MATLPSSSHNRGAPEPLLTKQREACVPPMMTGWASPTREGLGDPSRTRDPHCPHRGPLAAAETLEGAAQGLRAGLGDSEGLGQGQSCKGLRPDGEETGASTAVNQARDAGDFTLGGETRGFWVNEKVADGIC